MSIVISPIKIPANSSVIHHQVGTHIAILSASTEAGVSFTVNEQVKNALYSSISFKAGAYEKVEFHNENSSDVDLVVVFSNGEFFNSKISGVGKFVTIKGGNISNGNITVTDSATQIVASDSERTEITIQNNGSHDVYIGASGVTTANGTKIAANGGSITLATSAAIYSIVEGASNTTDVRFIALNE